MRFTLVLLFSAAWLGTAGPRGLAAQLVPLGPEIDLQTDVFPNKPLLAAQPGGDSVIVWDDSISFNSFPYRYMAAGHGPSRESSVFSPFDRPQVEAVTATPTGFDVIWVVASDDDEPKANFYLSHISLRGVSERRRVRLGGSGFYWVWQLPGSGFLAGWIMPHAHGIGARRLSSSGRRSGPELRLNSRPVDEPRPVVVPVADGGFVAAWFGTLPGSTAGSSSTKVLRARRFSPAGTPLGPDFDLNTTPLRVDSERGPFLFDELQVAAAPDGGFAVAWAYDDSIYLRFFDAAGQALGPEIPVEAAEEADQASSIAFDPAGNLLLLWADSSNEGLQLQLFDPHGVPLGPPTGVRSRASGIFTAPVDGRVVWGGDSWIVAWIAAGMPQSDFFTILVRRFAER
jgi:hypothetical protein